MVVEKFSYFSTSDKYDMDFAHELSWSRVYEYPFVLSEIDQYESFRIHNCSWGFRDIHVVFKTYLDILYPSTIHNDLLYSSLKNTEIWDITRQSRYRNEFDYVINVSTVEEVPFSHVQVIKNHLEQVKPGGKFIMTFDYPGIQLESVEDFLGQKIKQVDSPLNPANSALPDRVLNLPQTFRVGKLVIRK